MNEGLRALEPHEVIEFLLYSVRPRADMNATAHRLIERFGNVAGVLRASVEDMKGVEGVGEKTAEYLARVGRAMDACGRTDIEDRLPMGSSDAAIQCIRAYERFVTAPCACLMCLDMDSRLIFRRQMTNSLSWGEPEAMRAAMADILSARARCAIIALYGAEAFRPYDSARAEELAYVLRECGVTLLDVILLGGDRARSMRREGLMPTVGDDREARSLCEDYLRKDDE